MNSSQTNIEEDDPVDAMLKKTGCIELHYKVQVTIDVNQILNLYKHYFAYSIMKFRRSALLKHKIGESVKNKLKSSKIV